MQVMRRYAALVCGGLMLALPGAAQFTPVPG